MSLSFQLLIQIYPKTQLKGQVLHVLRHATCAVTVFILRYMNIAPIHRKEKDGDWYTYLQYTKTLLNERVKTRRKLVSYSNSTRVMLLV